MSYDKQGLCRLNITYNYAGITMMQACITAFNGSRLYSNLWIANSEGHILTAKFTLDLEEPLLMILVRPIHAQVAI